MSNKNIHLTNSKTFIKVRLLKPFNCDICQKSFYSKIQHQLHSVIHILPDHFNCDACQEGFTHVLNLDKHLEAHKNRMSIICHVCQKEFSDIIFLYEHIATHNNETTSILTKQKDIRFKEISQKVQNNFICDKCNKKFFKKISLDEHVKSCCIEKKLEFEKDEEIVSPSSTSKNSFIMSDGNKQLLVSDALDITEDTVSSESSQMPDDSTTSTLIKQKDICHEETSQKVQNNLEFNKEISEKNYLDEYIKNCCVKKKLESGKDEEIVSPPSTSKNSFIISDSNEQLLVFDALDITKDVVLAKSSHMPDGAKSFLLETKKQLEENKDAYLQINLNVKQFPCEICQRVFQSKRSLTLHFTKIHSKEKTFSSHMSGDTKSFSHGVKKQQEENKDACPKNNLNAKQFCCEVCQRVFQNKHSLAIHFSTHSTENIFNCDLCDKKFGLKCLLNAHQRCHRKNKISCNVCHKYFASKEKLFNHIYKHALVKSFSCNVCQVTFSDKSSLDEHRRSHPKKVRRKKVTCEVCQKVLSSKCALDSHMCIHTGARPFVCEVCSKAFTIQANLHRHRLIHTHERRFQCETCGERFTRKEILIKHQLIHSRNETQECSLCPEGVMLKSNGNSRFCIHLEVKPFKCNTCGKDFANKTSLKYHQYIHSGQTPYVCEICGKGYIYKQLLKSHQNSHSGIKPFLCETCGKRFFSRPNLITHSYSHLERKPYVCGICHKSFAYKQYLNHHVRIHTGEKPFVCDLCDKSFRQSSHLKRHLQSIHGMEKHQ